MEKTHTIFVVDDQESILRSITAVLDDEKYRTMTFDSAEDLISGLKSRQPDLILLDIWLPGIDGVQAVSDLKLQYPRIPIILMSGHAGIDIAVKGIKAGAVDFLEKPLNLDILLEKIAKHLPVQDLANMSQSPSARTHYAVKGSLKGAKFVESNIPQKTINHHAVMNGVGLLSGRPTGLIITPAPVDTGIIFRTLDGVDIPSHITYLENFNQIQPGKSFTANSTVLTHGSRRIRTVEHLLATLHMLGITNAIIKVDEEIPNIDGSAADFCRIIQGAEIVDQEKKRIEIEILQKILVGNEKQSEKYIYVEPYDGFEVNMRVDYPAPIFEQSFTYNPSIQSFDKEIAPARSFNTFENIDMAQQSGAAGSGFLNSHIIIYDGKVINTKLNFPDEFVRHKILDLLGDIYLLGYNLKGRIVGNMTSHGYNQQLAQKIHGELTDTST
jgi:UDP-3-O-[3-hydroxymyristoyl] N-acetylglucosamine deacetylase